MGSLFSFNKDEALIDELERAIFDCEVEVDYYKRKHMHNEVEFYNKLLAQRRSSLMQLKSSILLKKEESLTKRVNIKTKSSCAIVENFDETSHEKLLIDLKMNEQKIFHREKYSTRGIGEEGFEEEIIPFLPIVPTGNIPSQKKQSMQDGLY